MYTECVIYTILPSLNLWKLSSIVKIDQLTEPIKLNTICIIYPNINLIWYDSDLLNLFIKDNEMKEIITGMKNYNKIK